MHNCARFKLEFEWEFCWKLKFTHCVKSCNCPGTPPPSDFLNVYTPAGRTVGRFCGFSGKDQIEKWSPAIVVEPRKPGRFQVCSKTRPWEMEGFCVECRPGTKSWFQKKKGLGLSTLKLLQQSTQLLEFLPWMRWPFSIESAPFLQPPTVVSFTTRYKSPRFLVDLQQFHFLRPSIFKFHWNNNQFLVNIFPQFLILI